MLGLSVYNVISHTTNSLLTPNPMKLIAHTNTQSHTQYISIVIKEYYSVCVWPYSLYIQHCQSVSHTVMVGHCLNSGKGHSQWYNHHHEIHGGIIIINNKGVGHVHKTKLTAGSHLHQHNSNTT